MDPSETSRRGPAGWWAGWVAVVALFCAPMFAGLDRWELRSDEALYSYVVDRMLDTGDWLTPRNSPDDRPFLEKPPLKFWLIAGGIRSGLLPHDERGMRGLDALAAAAAFLYVYAIAARLVDPVAGVVAVLMLFSFGPLLHEHGLRSNNMEAALVVAYCGGMYHLLQWISDTHGPSRRRHALALAGWFTLAFLTKFVAALFLPVVALAAVLSTPGGGRDLARRWREWVLPAVLSALVIAPWFVYQSLHVGTGFWSVILGAHVVQRFTGVLHPEHLNPWHYYVTWTFGELWHTGLAAAWLIGLAALTRRACRAQEWRARAILWWCVLPTVILSAGTSKLFHYLYPFLPPVAIGVGMAASSWLALSRDLGSADVAARVGLDRFAPARDRVAGRVLAAVGVGAFALALWTALVGPVAFGPSAHPFFRSSLVWRPAVVGAVAWFLGGRGSAALTPLAWLMLVALVLPVPYLRQLDLLLRVDHPLRTLRDCTLDVERARADTGRGIFDASGETHHAYFYYLRHVAPWRGRETAGADELQRRLEAPGQQTPVLVTREDYVRLGGHLPANAPPRRARPTDMPPLAPAPPLAHDLPVGVLLSDDNVILFPAPFAGCSTAVMRDAVAATLVPTRAAPAVE